MIRNLIFFEENKCGDVFTVLNEYLVDLMNLNNELRNEIGVQRAKLIEINSLLEKGINPPVQELIECNKKSTRLLKTQKIVKLKITEVNSIMTKYILDCQKSSLKFFKRVLKFYIEKEDYRKCEILKNVISALK